MVPRLFLTPFVVVPAFVALMAASSGLPSLVAVAQALVFLLGVAAVWVGLANTS